MTHAHGFRERLSHLYGSENEVLSRQLRRWDGLVDQFRERFGESEVGLFSTPGRTEIGGNHTDHNHGKVLAASVHMDSIAVAAKASRRSISLFSEGYPEGFQVGLDELSPRDSERGTTAGLVRGIAARFGQLGYGLGGFNACMTSDVLVGSGLSSSASIEILIATIINCFYNNGEVEPQTIALIGQFAENNYFGKPCGLMDQTTCAVGGIIKIDFANPHNPHVEKIEFDFAHAGYSLLVVDTGGNHADLTEDYASIPREMKSVAAHFHKEWCRDISRKEIFKDIRGLRGSVGDRAFLRAFHFIEENERVELQVEALRARDIQAFLRLVTESGRSSLQWLQNCSTTNNVMEQSITLGLALSEHFLKRIGAGACRVHGGGFAGTILVFLPHERVPEYISFMESAFTPGCVKQLRIRPIGTTSLMQKSL